MKPWNKETDQYYQNVLSGIAAICGIYLAIAAVLYSVIM